MLGAFGADVVKIEPPKRGDPLRSWRALDNAGTSYWWRSIARNKRSVALDLASEDGRGIARKLLHKVDVVIENFRPGRMEAWGLGPEDLTASHPDLIYTRVSGYGQTGPYAARPGFASACEAEAGLRYVNGHPNQTPVRLNLSLGDSMAAMHAVVGVLLALLSRERSTVACGGQVIDVSIVESIFNMMEGVYPEFAGAGVVREPSGTTVTGIVPTNTYRCSDNKCIVIGGNGDSIFKRLMIAIDKPSFATDTRMQDNKGRVAHEAEIDAALASWCAAQSSVEALTVLANADVPSGPVNSIREIAEDPHFRARGAFETVIVNGESRQLPAVHPKLSKTPATTLWAGPELGEHTDVVLTDWLQCSEAELGAWRSRGVIA